MHTTATASLPANTSKSPCWLDQVVLHPHVSILPTTRHTHRLTPTLDSLLFSQQPAGGPGSGFPPDRKGKGRATDTGSLPGDPKADFLALDIDGDRGESGMGGGGDYQQMQLVEQQVSRGGRSSFVRSESQRCRLIGISGFIYPIEIHSDRIHRIDDRRARLHLLSTGRHGRRATRDGPAYRCRHDGYRRVRCLLFTGADANRAAAT
jgi:hypothetical protein